MTIETDTVDNVLATKEQIDTSYITYDIENIKVGDKNG